MFQIANNVTTTNNNDDDDNNIGGAFHNAPDLQQQQPLNLLSKLIRITSSPLCIPQGSFRLGSSWEPSFVTWLDATFALRAELARNFVWGRRREFALFWRSVGGPLAAGNNSGEVSCEAETSAVASLLLQQQQVVEQRTAFIRNPANGAFLRTKMVMVLFVPNATYRRTIASYL